jgi:hypothetical protein
VLNAEAERFERRLTEEIAGVRTELNARVSEVRNEMQSVRLELHDGLAGVRQDMAAFRSDMAGQMANLRVDVLKWSFLFWVGQVATIAALLSFMLRAAALK